ncbi:hypothetical protein CAEBREN_21155 [Caenorhabditis brenneri]|uniref:Uncharacterized protein n=1 Tax=Caenorhabditis brenneri TaxID=135651 RepID=G0NDP4_CAEBE|nr:hypothetical protein CAEBREN_21155 [Caenorhabditis brenneri]
MFSFLRRKPKGQRARLLTQSFSSPLHLQEEDDGTEVSDDFLYTSNASLNPSGNEMHVELPLALVQESHVSTCTIMMEPEGHYKKIGTKSSMSSSKDTKQEEAPTPAPRTAFLTKGVTVRISSKPDGDLTIGTKPSSSILPFPTITQFTRVNNWEFNVLVDVPVPKDLETDMARLKREVDDSFDFVLQAADVIKTAFEVIESHAVKEAHLKILEVQKAMEKQKMLKDGQGQSSGAGTSEKVPIKPPRGQAAQDKDASH